MRTVKGPEPVEIIRLTTQARLKNPRSKISFGCARPGGEHKGLLERGLIVAGINALAFPLDETVEFSSAMGLSVTFSEDCYMEVCEIGHWQKLRGIEHAKRII